MKEEGGDLGGIERSLRGEVGKGFGGEKRGE
jgi:hypothetical protein